jgi:hypothetical protein
MIDEEDVIDETLVVHTRSKGLVSRAHPIVS